MALIAKKKTFALIEPNIYVGTCYAVIDLGDQYDERYRNERRNGISRKIMLMWEITDEYVEIDGKKEPRVISKDYALSWGDRP